MAPDGSNAGAGTVAPSTLAALGLRTPGLRLVSLGDEAAAFAEEAARAVPDRYESFPAGDVETAVRRAAERADGGAPVVLVVPSRLLLGTGYAVLREAVALPRRSVTVVSDAGGWDTPGAAVLEDVALATTLPGFAVVVPADARTAAEALGVLVAAEGPGYLRLPPRAPADLGGPAFALGQARPLRDGRDIGLLAVGSMVPVAQAAGAELERVGITSRVLDLASVRPLDQKAILRAGRDTGALLVLEETVASLGLADRIAGITAEADPVLVRRLGPPDLPRPGAPAEAGRRAMGLGVDAVVDEAWELLRRKGKVE